MTREIFIQLLVVPGVLGISFGWFIWKIYDINIKKTKDACQEFSNNIDKIFTGKINKEEFDKQTENIHKKISQLYIPVVPLIILLALCVVTMIIA